MDFNEFIEKNRSAYDILRLRHQQDKTYKELAEQFNISPTRVMQKYRRFLFLTAKFYYHFLKYVYTPILPWELFDFYDNPTLTIAYYEKEYKEKLEELRNGVPPLTPNKISYFPIYRKLSEEDLLELEKKIVKGINIQHRKYIDIAQELDISREKAQRIYKSYYSRKISQAINKIKGITNNDISDYIYEYSDSPLKRWELIKNEYSDLIQDLIQIE